MVHAIVTPILIIWVLHPVFFPGSGSESGFHFYLDSDPDPVSVPGSWILGTKVNRKCSKSHCLKIKLMTVDGQKKKKAPVSMMSLNTGYRSVFFPKSGFGLETLETYLS